VKGIAFYEAAAQVIPVLLIVMALEQRAFATPFTAFTSFGSIVPGLTKSPRYTRTFATLDYLASLALLGFVIAAEAVALDVLVNESASDLQRRVVKAAVLIQLGWIFGRALSSMAMARERRDE
jgi:hypothetical protein